MHTKGPHGGAALRRGGSKKPRRPVWSCCACAAGMSPEEGSVCHAGPPPSPPVSTVRHTGKGGSQAADGRAPGSPPPRRGAAGDTARSVRGAECQKREQDKEIREPGVLLPLRVCAAPSGKAGRKIEQAGTVLYLSSPCLCVTRRIIGTVHGSKVDHRSYRERGYPCGQKPDPQRPAGRPPTRAPFHPHHRDPTLCPALSHPRARADD